MELAFWLSVACLVYVYVGYPAAMWTCARWTRPVRSAPWEPTVSVLVAAYNEAPRIQARLRNLLALDYPRDRFEVCVGSDGSTDETVAMARAYEEAGVRVVAREARQGKAAVLNHLASIARGEILVFADARQVFAKDAVRALVAPFADPRVGAVSGELMFTRDGGQTATAEGVGLYWRYEKAIRQCESRVDSTVGATGAIYAIRRALFDPIPEETILDDVLLPMRVARRGQRVVFEPQARAYDRVARTPAEEFTRKVRTIAGNFQLFARERWLLDPLRNRLWVQTVSHKLLRLAGPALLAMVLVSSVALSSVSWIYAAALGAQGLFYVFAVIGYAHRGRSSRSRLGSAAYVFCLLNAATVVAAVHFFMVRPSTLWKKPTIEGWSR
jgi:biofilm PGA synthesis N-glycosyltransferase PgaC